MEKRGKTKKEIKAIIFDIGGVLIPEASQNQYISLSKKFGLDLERFRKLRHKYIWKALEKNKPFEYERLIAKDLKINPKRFITYWQKLREKEMNFSPGTKKILNKLSKRYILGTLTNVLPSHELIRKKKKIYRYFKINLKSCEIGVHKPSIEIFRILLKQLKNKAISKEEFLFVDDRKDNILSAKNRGIKTILFVSNNQLIRDLRKLGVEI